MIKKNIPNTITLMNMLCGCVATVYAFNQDYKAAFYLIILSALLDFADGLAARMLKAYSDIGKELDSLSDVISFGFVPSAIVFNILNSITDHHYIPYIAFLIVLFSGLRLAKFNIDDRQSDEFIGMPTPAAAMLVSSIGYLIADGNELAGNFFLNSYIPLVALSIIVSALLVSNIRMFALKFKFFSFRENTLRYCFIIVSLGLIIVFKVAGITLSMVLYILISAVKMIQKGQKTL